MFCFDLETVGIESTAGVLSLAIVHFDPAEEMSYQRLLKSTFFVKFDLKEQLKVYDRTTTPSVLDWWRRQNRSAQVASLIPSDRDVSCKEGIAQLRSWFNKFPGGKNEMIWARGSLDQPVFESFLRALDEPPIVNFSQWRDVRTALECFYPSATNGYVEVDVSKCPDFDARAVIKHHPVHDCAFDVCQLFAGK